MAQENASSSSLVSLLVYVNRFRAIEVYALSNRAIVDVTISASYIGQAVRILERVQSTVDFLQFMQTHSRHCANDGKSSSVYHH